MRSFGSDNNSGIHPRVLEALIEANNDHAPGYGMDRWTAHLTSLIKNEFGDEAEAFISFNGTGANIFALASFLNPQDAVLATHCAHVYCDENGALERMTGCKVIGIPAQEGKLTPALVEPQLKKKGSIHASQPKIVSITQSNELGLIYLAEEIKEISLFCKQNELFLHMDGARLSNAAAALGLSLQEASSDLGIDILSLGGTKNGLMGAELVIFFNQPQAAKRAKFIQKQSLQLASKMRFLSAQLCAFFTDELWRANALHANTMAQALHTALKDIKGVTISTSVATNMVFAELPKKIVPQLLDNYFFYVMDEERGEVRLVTSFDTTLEDVKGFSSEVERLIRTL